MDIIERHFAAENAHDVQATLDTYTDDIVWDDITHPGSPFRGKQQVGRVYSGIIEAIPDVSLTSVRRFMGEDGRYVVDESIITGHVHGEWAGMQGGGAPVEVRIRADILEGAGAAAKQEGDEIQLLLVDYPARKKFIVCLGATADEYVLL